MSGADTPAPRGVDRRRLLAALLGGPAALAAIEAVRGVGVALALGAPPLWFSDIASLVAAPAPSVNTQLAFVHGYFTAGDGGGGLFQFVAGSVAGADGGTIFAPADPTAGRWHRIYDGALNIRWFGAMPGANPPSSPYRGIQAALDAAAVAGDGAVYVPAGIYDLWTSVAPVEPVIIHGGVTLYGDGPASTLRVPDLTIGYRTMVTSGNAGRTYVERVTIRDLRFDQNAAGNSGVKPTHTAPFRVLEFYSVNQFVIDRCQFDGCIGLQAIALSGRVTVVDGVQIGEPNDIVVRDCLFRMQATGPTDYDNSTLYTDAMAVTIVNNVFYGEAGAGEARPATAIETHRGPVTITGNLIDGCSGTDGRRGYATGMNVCSAFGGALPQDPTPAVDAIIADNLIRNVNSGVVLWSFDGYRFRNLSIINNRIAVMQRSAHLYTPLAPFAGVMMNAAVTPEAPLLGTYEDIVIAGNHIQLQIDDRPTVTYAAAGLSLNPVAPIAGLVVTNNTIVDSPQMGIALGHILATAPATAVTSTRIASNHIINAGHNGAAPQPGYRVAIRFAGDRYTDVQVEANRIVEDATMAMPSPRFALVRDLAFTVNERRVGFGRNRVDSASGKLVSVQASSLADARNKDHVLVVPAAAFSPVAGVGTFADGEWLAGVGGLVLHAPLVVPVGAVILYPKVQCQPLLGLTIPAYLGRFTSAARVLYLMAGNLTGLDNDYGLFDIPTTPANLAAPYQLAAEAQLYFAVQLSAAGQRLAWAEVTWIEP